MSRFDRYMLSQFLVLFGFFALVLVSVYWINRAVKLFDTLIADGQSAFVFLEFTALSLPNVIRVVLPMSCFAAAVYVTNRLSSESELTVMQATGFSPWRLARPVLTFGLIVATMMSVLTHFLVPASLSELADRQREISENVTARLLSDGTFLHPTDGVTFYIREITPSGVLKDVLLSDRRTPDQTLTYTASEAYLIQDDSGPKLVMVDGLSQIHVADGNRLFTTNFSDFSYDISSLVSDPSQDKRRLRYIGTGELLRNSHELARELDVNRGEVMEEAHGRFAQAIMCVVAALIGFATLLLGGFSRFGVWRHVVVAFVLLVVVETVRSLVVDPVTNNADLWPLMYLPGIVGLLLAFFLLFLAARPVFLRSRSAA